MDGIKDVTLESMETMWGPYFNHSASKLWYSASNYGDGNLWLDAVVTFQVELSAITQNSVWRYKTDKTCKWDNSTSVFNSY